MRRAVACAVAVALNAVAPGASAASAAPDLAAIMRLTVDGWVASQSAGGLFPYGFDFLADSPTEPNYISRSNLIRQAGSAYALASYYRHTSDARLQEPLQRLLSSFVRHSLPVGKSRTQHWIERTRVLSLPFARWKIASLLERFDLLYEPEGEGRVVSPDDGYEDAVSGTVALVLLTELTYSQAAKDERFAAMRAAWLKGLLSMRIPGGGFRRSPTSIDDSDYFNGEGWLALAVYGDLHRNDVAVAAELVALESAMMDRYTQNPKPGFYPWARWRPHNVSRRHAIRASWRFCAGRPIFSSSGFKHASVHREITAPAWKAWPRRSRS